MKRSSLLQGLASGCALAALSGVSGAQAQNPPELRAESNVLQVVPADGTLRPYEGSRVMNEMRARLEDPQQRAKYREDQRQGIVDSHYGIADALRLDAATFDRLMDVLVDQQMERSDYFHAMFAGKLPLNPTERMHGEAQRVTQQVDALREVLGQEKLEHYQKLSFSLGQRRQIREIDERLAAADKLDTAQRERLVELMNDHFLSSMERRHGLNSQRSLLGDAMRSAFSHEERQRQSELRMIALNEASWREMPESNRRLRERAAEFLTPNQVAVLEQMHAEQLASLQQRIEEMRVQAGLSPTIPEQAPAAEVPSAVVTRDVRISLKVGVNGATPKHLTTVVTGGKPASMKIADNLFLEATPILFDDDSYHLRVQYFETGVTGRRLIGSMSQGGMVIQATGEARHVGGGGGTVLTGSKGYAVDLSALVEAT